MDGVGAAGLEGLGGRQWWVSKVHGVLRCTWKGWGWAGVGGVMLQGARASEWLRGGVKQGWR